MGSECVHTFGTKVNRYSIMKKQRIFTIDNDSLSISRTVKATDPIFDRFKCPLFYKFIISLSGFADRDRNTIKQYVEREG